MIAATALHADAWVMDDASMAAMGLCPMDDDPDSGTSSGPDGRALSPDALSSGPDAMWRHILGEASIPVGKLARVRAPKGVRLRTRAAPDQPDLGILPFDEMVSVERRTEHGWCWVVPMGQLAGTPGFCEEQFLSIDPPEPTAHLHRVAPGDSLRGIAEQYYGKQFRDGRDARLYVQALYEANRGHKGIYLTEVQLDRSETLHRGEDEEHTLEIYKGAKVREGHVLWVPSEAFIEQLRSSGAISSGSSELSQAWRGAKAAVGDVVAVATYGAAFTVGLLEGAWNAIVELFQGAAEMIELVAKTVYQLVTGNPGAIKAMLMGWVDKLRGAWAGRDKLADAFMAKWESEDTWARGNFQGEVLGWVMMTALLILATAGASSIATAPGKWAGVMRVLSTVDALGDVTTYVGKVARLPIKAAAIVRRRLGKGAEDVTEAAEELVDAEGDAARAISHSSSAEARHAAQDGNPDLAKGGYGSWGGRRFDPDAAGGPIRSLSTARIRVTPRGIEVIEKHLARFGQDVANEGMLQRLREIAAGRARPTSVDLNFYSHELREFARYRKLGFETGAGDNYELWNNTHSATLADYGLTEGPGVLYHPEVAP